MDADRRMYRVGTIVSFVLVTHSRLPGNLLPCRLLFLSRSAPPRDKMASRVGAEEQGGLARPCRERFRDRPLPLET